jgi:hypothetical protein
MRLPAVVAGVAAAAALASGDQGESSAAHPCTLISNEDVARIIGPGGHVEVGGRPAACTAESRSWA